MNCFNKYCFSKKFLFIFFSCILSLLLFCQTVFAADIVIYGDSQLDEAAQARVVQAIRQFKPAIIFRVGDIVDNGNAPEQWAVFNKIAAPLLQSAEYFPCLGNHENNSPLYFKNFGLKPNERWYSVNREGIHFIVLDSNADLQKSSEQYTWLVSELSQKMPDIKYKIVLFHHPLFGVGSYAEDEKGLKPSLPPLLKKYRVGAVFSGHEHCYERFKYRGIFFIVTGGGGSYLLDQLRTSSYLQKFEKKYHFCLLSPQKKFLKVRVYDVDLNLIDEFNIPAQSKGW
jgi:predicted MPP superfamily phosphohydrolase